MVRPLYTVQLSAKVTTMWGTYTENYLATDFKDEKQAERFFEDLKLQFERLLEK